MKVQKFKLLYRLLSNVVKWKVESLDYCCCSAKLRTKLSIVKLMENEYSLDCSTILRSYGEINEVEISDFK